PRGALDIRMAAGLDMPGLNWPAQDVWPTYHKGAFSVLHLRTSPIDTFGYKSSYGEYNLTNYTDAQLAGFRHFRAVVEHATFDLLGYPRQWVWAEDDTHGRTDHVPFVAAGIPGMRVHGPSDEEYPAYHDAGDTLPVLEYSAGGKDKLLAGLESSARVTALTAALMASEPVGGSISPASVPLRPAPDAQVPMVLGALALLALLRKR
ncbi:MAG: M28 family metallopeptidase, partial [Halobacteriales archaeon]|nr:M28 family metallopeptidase [Halobacteriales archaeon]